MIEVFPRMIVFSSYTLNHKKVVVFNELADQVS